MKIHCFALPLSLLLHALVSACAFVVTKTSHRRKSNQFSTSSQHCGDEITDSSRRSILQSTLFTALVPCFLNVSPASAATREPLSDVLYRILRVKEAAQQETRLIKSGKFKDVQRANVKLAVRFMIDNYRLNDAFVTASAYLEGDSSRRIEASQVGQTAVQNLYTILEYFDTSDVQNLKVGVLL